MTVAILQVKNDDDINYDLMSSETNSSSSNSSQRSSVTSIDSNHDHTVPLELGLVIHALQISSEQEVKDLKPTQAIEIKSTKPVHSSDNMIVLNSDTIKHVKPSILLPREQEIADEPVCRAIHLLFNNQFMEAKKLFETHANTDPLHASGLGFMSFFKATMTLDPKSIENAIQVLISIYTMATAQISRASGSYIGSSIFQYVSSCYQNLKSSRASAIPIHATPVKPKLIETHKTHIIPNGTLRAHVIKAEACLQMAILYLFQEKIASYVKCGLNLRRAYTSYSIVWQEYKRMGQLHNEYIDQNTISGIQFGIGAIHLILSSLPPKILCIISAFSWKPDRHLGFALLKLCFENKQSRSPLASAMLLAYYTTLIQFCPQLLADTYTQPAIETLLEAQKIYPNSSIFLYFAGKTSRIAQNLNLSTESFLYAIETSKKEWAEVEIHQASRFEMGINQMMQNNWKEAVGLFHGLFQEGYGSPAVLCYLTGACLDMLGQRTEAILTFAQIPALVRPSARSYHQKSTSGMESYVMRKVVFFQQSGYQDMDMTMCALECLYLINAYQLMDMVQLEQNLSLTDYSLSKILEAEKLEYSIRAKELLPETPPPQYDNQRSVLLLIKAAILNAMGRAQEAIVHLNWIIDHKATIKIDSWALPFAYWEVGCTSWSLNHKTRAQQFWEAALRLAMQIHLAMTQASSMTHATVTKLDNKLSESQGDQTEEMNN
ncbi:Tetratricopeptide repeat protein 39C [Choanephora cucurbitarum]|uniref:Tetratricopeptide repeat protein 39C n=1 Tax=Choanephora cucurbitarum TaxID=101091 RepID=A0A1C7NT63_9FUNG|nr:Tetratricopeptide repeat protein 39C [Choanephora cucurbitarum]